MITRYLFILTVCLTKLIMEIAHGEHLQHCESAESGEPCDASVKPNAVGTTSLAVVPYDDGKISDFYRTERKFGFGDVNIVIKQNWQALGVAAVVWDSAVTLCGYLQQHEELVTRKRAVELGAGTGLVGIMASKLGATTVTITDRGLALDGILENANSNQCSNVVVSELDWGRNLADYPDTFDVILGADIIYVEETFDDLLSTFRHLSNPETEILLACRIRYERDERFLAMMRQSFSMVEVLYDEPRDVRIFSARKLPVT